MTLPEQYDPKAAQTRWQAYWKERGTYAFREGEPVFSIDTPPPTVSGRMHLGHAFSYTQGDIIARYKRMRGFNVLYPFGTDDNGLPTERLVEKEKKVHGPTMDRKAFRELCYTTVQELLPEFSAAWKDIAMSADFDHAYSTIDEHSQRVSQQSFLDLHRRGYVYRKESPFAWCVTCQTAIAQAEFESVELPSAMNEIRFGTLVHGKPGSPVVIATTRPELIPACVALCYHPGDTRYNKALAHAHAVVPITGHTVPLIADTDVDMTKGTGLMMVCTFGDKEDIEKWKRHKLPMRQLFTKDGKLTDLAGPFVGLKIKEARKRVIEHLTASGELLSSKPLQHAVNTHERCATEIEFMQTTQWFVNVLDHKERLLAAADDIRWYPEHMKVRYQHWVQNLSWDWAISRQRFYGVPFPVWYSRRAGEEGKVLLADPQHLPVDPLTDLPAGYTRDEVEPETDVMDTWATSSTTPDIVLGWKTDGHARMHPMTVRFQAHDIIRTWAFYTIAKSVFSHGHVPWREIVISGHVLDPKGQKMSKSKGNIVDPIEVMATHSTDVLRYWTASGKLGDDHLWQEKDINTAKRLVTKLFNAGKFTIANLNGYDPNETATGVELETLDRWMLGRLAATIEEATAYFEQYEYSKARGVIDAFFWNTYCDLYLELVKDRIYSVDRRGMAGRTAAQHALHSAFLAIIKLYAPFMPYVTEELYQGYFTGHDGHHSIHVSAWPTAHEEWKDAEAARAGDEITTVLGGVRKFRAEKQLGMKTPLARLTIFCDAATRKRIEPAIPDLQATANVADVEWSEAAGLSWELEQ
jgi:valyl-tRNA synthetase